MKKTVFNFIIAQVIIGSLLILSLAPFQGCKPDDDNNCDTSQVYKPNICLYPEQETNLSVELFFPKEAVL